MKTAASSEFHPVWDCLGGPWRKEHFPIPHGIFESSVPTPSPLLHVEIHSHQERATTNLFFLLIQVVLSRFLSEFHGSWITLVPLGAWVSQHVQPDVLQKTGPAGSALPANRIQWSYGEKFGLLYLSHSSRAGHATTRWACLGMTRRSKLQQLNLAILRMGWRWLVKCHFTNGPLTHLLDFAPTWKGSMFSCCSLAGKRSDRVCQIQAGHIHHASPASCDDCTHVQCAQSYTYCAI